MNAQTTLEQLGGGKIFAMAFDRKHVVHNAQANSLTLKIARALVKGTRGKATHVVITLDPSDTYTVELKRVGRDYSITDVSTTSVVYGDQLADVVETMTGLRLSL